MTVSNNIALAAVWKCKIPPVSIAPVAHSWLCHDSFMERKGSGACTLYFNCEGVSLST